MKYIRIINLLVVSLFATFVHVQSQNNDFLEDEELWEDYKQLYKPTHYELDPHDMLKPRKSLKQEDLSTSTSKQCLFQFF